MGSAGHNKSVVFNAKPEGGAKGGANTREALEKRMRDLQEEKRKAEKAMKDAQEAAAKKDGSKSAVAITV